MFFAGYKVSMGKNAVIILWLILCFSANGLSAAPSADVIKTDVVTISVERQYDAIQPGSKSALAVHFELAKDWHFYSSAETAPGGMNLKLEPPTEGMVSFSEPIFPQAQLYFDKFSGQRLGVFSDKFTVFLPFSMGDVQPKPGESVSVDVRIGIEGAVCSDIQCRVPDFGSLGTVIKITDDAVMSEPKFVLPEVTEVMPTGAPTSAGQWASYSAWFALALALLAGLSLNIMPCVWPVLPLIVMRIVEQAKADRRQSIAMGLSFCFGILLFFACFAGVNAILRLFYATVLELSDPFRNPVFIILLAMILIVMALFMFGVFTITIPASIANKSGSRKGYPAAVGMGFLAAIMGTPCSFGILGAAMGWAQSQSVWLGTLAIMVIGVGMAVPYAILTSMPGLLNRLPKAGRWMELFKQGIGFILLIVAIWLIGTLAQEHRISVLYFALVLSFCVWMWGTWVSYNTARPRKWVIRTIAVLLVVLAGLFFLMPRNKVIDWQNYDAGLIDTALEESRPVLIEFTADWCLSCKVVEKMVYSRKDIAKLIEEKGVLAIKADTTGNNPATLAKKNVYNEPGVPVSILLVPGTEQTRRWHGKFFADELRIALEKLPSKKQ
jgi:thiol:disulfide interchange protein